MVQEAKQLTVIVHKAAIELMTGETLSQFTAALNGALREYLKSKLGLGKLDWVWTADVKAGEAISSVYKEGVSKTLYYQVKYERDEKGVFKFSDMTEVEPQVVYTPVKLSLVTKAATETVALETDATPTQKSIWHNVL